MSSKRNRKRDNFLNTPSSAPRTPDPSHSGLETMDQGIYGEIAKIDGDRRIAEAVDILSIMPDPAQPRRALPSVIRRQFQEQPLAHVLPDVFARWVEQVNNEHKDTFPLDDILLGEEQEADYDGDAEQASPQSYHETFKTPLARSLLELAELAASIRRDGLTNPITVVSSGPNYIIETGERRWLAYHLLYATPATHDEKYARIPAHEVDNLSVWRQANENNARQNLNAIGRARQLALLLMDLHGMENFQPLGAFEHERDFYAQVADGQSYRIPRGSGEKLLNAMGFSNPAQLRQYRALLRLSREAWEEADDRNLSEGQIRTSKRDSVTPVTVSPVVRSVESGLSALDKLTPQRIQQLNSQQREELRNLLATYRQRLDSLDDWLTD